MDASGTSGALDAGAGSGFASPPRRFRVAEAPAGTARRAEAKAGPGAAPLAMEARSGFAAPKAVNWPAIGLIAGLHVALAAGLVSLDVVNLKLPTHAPMTVDLVPAAPPPAPPEPVIEPQLAEITPVIVPPRIDILPPRESPVRAVVQPQPAAAPVSHASRPTSPAPAAGPAIETVADLSATMISATPPRYPVESRRRKEEGTVVLLLTIGPDGRVADIRVSRSSGFDRLDKAALVAVKKWRWSPTVRDGVAVAVRGLVEIPFILRK